MHPAFNLSLTLNAQPRQDIQELYDNRQFLSYYSKSYSKLTLFTV